MCTVAPDIWEQFLPKFTSVLPDIIWPCWLNCNLLKSWLRAAFQSTLIYFNIWLKQYTCKILLFYLFNFKKSKRMPVDITATHAPEEVAFNGGGKEWSNTNGWEEAMEDYKWEQRTLNRAYQRSDLIFSSVLETSIISKLKYLSRYFNKAPVDIVNKDN